MDASPSRPSPTGDPVVRVVDLRKAYGATRAVDGVSFTVRRTHSSATDIEANIRFSATLKTGCPQGSSS